MPDPRDVLHAEIAAQSRQITEIAERDEVDDLELANAANRLGETLGDLAVVLGLERA